MLKENCFADVEHSRDDLNIEEEGFRLDQNRTSNQLHKMAISAERRRIALTLELIEKIIPAIMASTHYNERQTITTELPVAVAVAWIEKATQQPSDYAEENGEHGFDVWPINTDDWRLRVICEG